MSAKLVTVFGATGNQGGSVAYSLLNNSTDFRVRGITRNPSSEKAQALASAGAEVVKADGLKKEEIIEALKGSWGFYFNTSSEDPTVNEIEVGKNIIDAAAAAGVQHIIYSAGAAANEVTKGAAPLMMMDNKAEITAYLKSSGKFSTIAFVDAGWYLENFLIPSMADVLGGFPYNPSDDGTYQLTTPRWGGTESVPFISITDDYGDIVHGVFLSPQTYNGKQAQACSDPMGFVALCEAFEKGTGKKARWVEVEVDKFETYGDPVLEQVKGMFRFTQCMGGKYFGDVETEAETAKGLKKSVGEKTGGRTTLMGGEEWFKREFGGK